MLNRIAVTVLTLLALSGCDDAASKKEEGKEMPVSAWVWNRTAPFEEKEVSQLKNSGIHRIYWQLGELKQNDGKLEEIAQWPLPENSGGISFHPVVRLDSSIQDPLEINPGELAEWIKKAGATEFIQFDYDCPTRLLPRYAELLSKFREAFGKAEISCTALLSWTDSAHFPKLEHSVDSIYPMFYDALPEPPQTGDRPSDAIPLIEVHTFSRQLSKWESGVSIPWHVGLPNFTRLSIFRNGEPQGHIRSWTKKELLGNPAMEFEGEAGVGISLFCVTTPTRIGTVSLQKKDWLCFRQCDRKSLAQSLHAARQSSADSIVWYQLPRDGLASSGWSIPELGGNFLASEPSGKAEIKDSRLHFFNSGAIDFPFTPNTPHHLILSSGQPFLREVKAGDFSSVEFFRDGIEVPAFAATEVRVHFHQLHAGKSLTSGLFLVREPSNSLQIEYRTGNGRGQKLEIIP